MIRQRKTKRSGARRKARAPPQAQTGGKKSGDVARAVGGQIGTAIGRALGGGPLGAVGGFLGSGAGTIFNKITGLGDYKVTSNTLMGAAATDSLPSFTKSGRGVRLTHREYLSDVLTSPTIGQFDLNTYPIQPALGKSFPWLSSLAANFEEYMLNGMVFEFKSNSYDAMSSTNTASGTVIMTTQYNVLSSPFINKQQMEQYEFTCSSKPSVNLMHAIECARGESPVSVLSTRVADVSTGDLRLYDFGNFNIATVGMQGASTNIGEIWVSYDVTLFKPRLGSTVTPCDTWDITGALLAEPDVTSLTFGPLPFRLPGSSFGTTVIGGYGMNDIVIPPTYNGKVQVTYYLETKTAQDPGDLISTHLLGLGGATALTVNNSGTVALYTDNILQITAYFNIVGGGTIRFENIGPWGAPTTSYGRLIILALPQSFVSDS